MTLEQVQAGRSKGHIEGGASVRSLLDPLWWSYSSNLACPATWLPDGTRAPLTWSSEEADATEVGEQKRRMEGCRHLGDSI